MTDRAPSCSLIFFSDCYRCNSAQTLALLGNARLDPRVSCSERLPSSQLCPQMQ